MYYPPTISPVTEPLGVIGSLRAARRNALSIIPDIAFSQSIVSGKTGPARWHMVQGPEGMKRVFLDNEQNYPKSEVMIRMLRPVVGRSLFTADQSDWRWQRRAISPVFRAKNVNDLAPFMSTTALRAADHIASHNGAIPIVQSMMSATFEVICDVALSGSKHFNIDAYTAAITRYLDTIGRASLLDFMRVPPWFPRPAELFGAGAVKTMHRMVAKAIDQRQQGRGSINVTDDLLDHMLNAQDPETGRKMSAKDVLHNMQFFIVAGHETSAITLAWALLMLAYDTKIQDQARTEAQNQLNGRPATSADIEKMPFISAILQETLRLYPPVGILARDAQAPDRIYDREIKRRDTIFLNIYAMHRSKMYWDDPSAFNPDRFLDNHIKKLDRYVHLPFGAGPRICVGANFALLQVGIILATLLTKFRFEPSGDAPKPVMHMTVRPDPEIYLRAYPL